MDLPQLKALTAALEAQAFRPSTMANHVLKPDWVLTLCGNYSLKFINPSPSTLCYFIYMLVSYLFIFKGCQELCFRGLVSSQAACPDPRGTGQLPSFLSLVASRRQYEDGTSATSAHRAPPPHPALPALCHPVFPGTCHEGLPHLRVPGDAQVE